MINPATANLTWAITNGWEESKAILVAVDAEAHKNAKAIPAMIQLYSCLIGNVLLKGNKILISSYDNSRDFSFLVK